MKRSEHGAALLSVLLLVAVIAVLAAASLHRLKLATHLAGNAIAIDQARAYAMAAETLARFRIGDLIQRDATKTTLAGNWANQDVNFPIDSGTATARLSDAGNCFNLNSLVFPPTNTGYAARPEAMAQFARLMTLVGIGASDAQRVAAAAADWIDSDETPQPGGAEDETYGRAPTPYRAANTLMADVSELRAVAGVTADLYSRVRPLLCALPVTDLSPINVNTILPDQAPLLAMLVPGLDNAQAQQVIAARPAAGFDTLTAFWNLPSLGAATEGAKAQVRLTSRWFGLHLQIELRGAALEESALIDAGLRPAKIVQRAYGEPS